MLRQLFTPFNRCIYTQLYTCISLRRNYSVRWRKKHPKKAPTKTIKLEDIDKDEVLDKYIKEYTQSIEMADSSVASPTELEFAQRRNIDVYSKKSPDNTPYSKIDITKGQTIINPLTGKKVKAEEILPFLDEQEEGDKYISYDDISTTFKKQFGWEEKHEKAMQELYENVSPKYRKLEEAPISFNISQKLMPDYTIKEDEEFKQFKRIRDRSQYYYGYTQNYSRTNLLEEGDEKPTKRTSKSDLTLDQLINMSEQPKPKVKRMEIIRTLDLDRYNWLKKSQQIKAERKFIDIPNPHYKHIFTTRAPKVITMEDCKKIFVISNEDYAKYFSNGMGGELEDVFKRISQRALMVRKPVIPVLRHLDKVKKYTETKKPTFETSKTGHIFVGIRGGGKSCCLATVAAYAAKNDMLVFYIPSARYWTHGPHYVEPSVLLKGYYDTPIPTEKFIKGFQLCNEHILKNMPLSKCYNLPLEAGQKQPETVWDLCQYAHQFFENNAVVLKLLLDELYYNLDVPMVFLIDDYNYFLSNTHFWYGDIENIDTTRPKPVHANELVLVRGLNRIIAQNAHNKTFVAAESHKTVPNAPRRILYESYPFEPIYVKRYSFEEMKNICEYYMSAHFVYGTPETYMEDLVFLTGGVPGRVWKEMTLY